MNILCIGFPAWEGDYLKSTVQLMGALAERHRVLYVEYPFTWKDAAVGAFRAGGPPAKRILGIHDRLREVRTAAGRSLHVLTLPPALPTNFLKKKWLHGRIANAYARLAEKTVRRAFDRLGWQPDVVVNAFNPMLGVPLAGRFGEKALVYYCYDEIAAAPWLNRHGSRYEALMLQKSDAAIFSSATLMAAKAALCKRAFTVKNGVDTHIFFREMPDGAAGQPAPADQPAIGYLGSVDDRLDFDLLEKTALAFPKNPLVLVGRINSAAARKLEKHPNVQLLGPQPPAELPGFVRQFGVCLIPFCINDLTAGIYPMKINEYLACGKPVVCTRFGDLADFEHMVRIADSPAGFIAEIGHALAENGGNPNDRAARRAFAAGNSWESRAAEFAQILEELRLD